MEPLRNHHGAKMEPRTKHLPHHVVIRVAAAASADPKTVKRFCEGAAVRGMVAERIEKALSQADISVRDEPGDEEVDG